MDTSIFLAKFWGLFMLGLSFVFLLKRQNFDYVFKIVKNEELVFVSGFPALAIGIFLILIHNIWASDWRVIITIMGWLVLLKGFMRLLMPEKVSQIAEYYKKGSCLTNIFLVVLFLGVYLTYTGFTQ